MKKIVNLIFSCMLVALFTLNVTTTISSTNASESEDMFQWVDCWDDSQVFYNPGHSLRYCADCSVKFDWKGWEVPQQCNTSYPYVPEPWCPPNGC